MVGFNHAFVSLAEGRKDTEIAFGTVYDYRSSSMAATTHSKEVTDVLVRFALETIEEWGHADSVLSCQQEPAEIKLHREIIRPRRCRKISHSKRFGIHTVGRLGGAERVT